jgi:hypothetical protein
MKRLPIFLVLGLLVLIPIVGWAESGGYTIFS